MEWWSAVLVAVVIQRCIVPRLTCPRLDEGDEPPDFTGLGTGAHLVLVAVFAGVVAFAGARSGAPVWPWWPYVALGAPLAVIDLRTTWLPNQLMHPLLVATALGLALHAVRHPSSALAGLVGAACAFGAFHLVWRVSRSFGYGDVRLAAAVGAVSGIGGLEAWLYALFAGTMLGAVAAIGHHFAGRGVSAYGPWLWLGPPAAALVVTGW